MDSTTTRWTMILLGVSMVVIFFLPQVNQCNASNAQEEEIQRALQEAAPEVSEETYRSSDELYEATGLRLTPPSGVGSATYSSTMVEGENPVAQMTFSTDALGCTYREMESDELVDISVFADQSIEWDTTEDADINGVTWTCSVTNEKGLAERYDSETETTHSFSVEGPDLTMRKMQAILGAMKE